MRRLLQPGVGPVPQGSGDGGRGRGQAEGSCACRAGLCGVKQQPQKQDLDQRVQPPSQLAPCSLLPPPPPPPTPTYTHPAQRREVLAGSDRVGAQAQHEQLGLPWATHRASVATAPRACPTVTLAALRLWGRGLRLGIREAAQILGPAQRG